MDLDNKYGTLEIQKELLMLLKEVHVFCVSNNIKYSIAYGSLLGAIRHKGFIPWDDDLDIMVDRDNYKKILDSIGDSSKLMIDRSFTSWIDRLRLKVSNNNGPSNSTCDIFLIDGVPNNIFLANLKLIVIYMLQGMMKEKLNFKKGDFIMKVCSIVTYFMGLLFSPKTKKKWYIQVSQWLNNDGQNKRCYNASFKDIHCIFPDNVLQDVHLAPFEDTTVYLIDRYDPFLKSRYGDYMTPPSESERVPGHTSII